MNYWTSEIYFFKFRKFLSSSPWNAIYLKQLISPDFGAVNVRDGVEQVVRLIDDHHRVLQLDAQGVAGRLVKQRVVGDDHNLKWNENFNKLSDFSNEWHIKNIELKCRVTFDYIRNLITVSTLKTKFNNKTVGIVLFYDIDYLHNRTCKTDLFRLCSISYHIILRQKIDAFFLRSRCLQKELNQFI